MIENINMIRMKYYFRVQIIIIRTIKNNMMTAAIAIPAIAQVGNEHELRGKSL